MSAMEVRHRELLEGVARYYGAKVAEYGPTPQGADWNSEESQQLRFEQLLKLCDTASAFSINDYGCGYGALAHFMLARGLSFKYYGFDISEAMIAQAKQFLPEVGSDSLFVDSSHLSEADYTVASGVFNVKLDAETSAWKDYVLETLSTLAEHSKLGFGFNMLTRFSDAERMRPDLYYADPLFFFDYCRKRFSRSIALLHDYRLYEFTILVRML